MILIDFQQETSYEHQNCLKIGEGTLVRHVAGKKGSSHTLYAIMRGGKFVECNEDQSKKDGLSFTGAPSNVGGGHYEQLIKSKHPSVGSRKQNSCNGWTEVEYWTGDTWEPTGNLRSPVATITDGSSSSSSSEHVVDSTMDATSVVSWEEKLSNKNELALFQHLDECWELEDICGDGTIADFYNFVYANVKDDRPDLVSDDKIHYPNLLMEFLHKFKPEETIDEESLYLKCTICEANLSYEDECYNGDTNIIGTRLCNGCKETK